MAQKRGRGHGIATRLAVLMLLMGSCNADGGGGKGTPTSTSNAGGRPSPGVTYGDSREVPALITSPKANERVEHHQPIAGTAPPLPTGKTYWLVIQPKSSPRYHPQPGPLIPGSDGSWSASVYFGASPTVAVGEIFTVFLVVANEQTSRLYQEYLEESDRERRYDGKETMDGGAPVSQVTVVRK
jgi:hypothetical protein